MDPEESYLSVGISSDSDDVIDEDSEEISVSEEEWNRSVLEIDKGFLEVGEINGNTVELNEQFNKEMDRLRKMITDEDYVEAKKLCETITSGDLKYRCDSSEFWILYAKAEKKLGTPDSVIDVYDRGCAVLAWKPRELANLSLDMRSYVEEVVDEEDAVDELELPISQDSIRKKTSLAQGMLSLMKRRDRLSEGGEIEFKPRTPSRPEGKSKRKDSSSNIYDMGDCFESTRIILTPIRASRSQQKKHKCDMILSPVRKSTRLMKNSKEDIVGDKLIGTTYAYANNKCIINKTIDA